MTLVELFRNGSLVTSANGLVDSPGRAADLIWSSHPGIILKGDVVRIASDDNQRYLVKLPTPFKLRPYEPTGIIGGGPPPTPVLVQFNHQASTGSADPDPFTCAFTGDVTDGNLLIACIGGSDVLEAPTSSHANWALTDTRSSPWSKVGEKTLGGNYWIQMWKAIALSSGPCTVSWTDPSGQGGQFARFLVHEVSGVDTLDIIGSASSTDPGQSQQTDFVIPLNTNHDVEFCIAWLVHNAGVSSVDAPWSTIQASSSEPTAEQITTAHGSLPITAHGFATDTWCGLTAGFYKA